LRTVRIVDRGSAQQHGLVPVSGSDTRRRGQDDEPGKPSIDDKRSYYWNGPGWLAAYNEARRLMASGLSADRAAPQVGWSTDDLDTAIKRGGAPPEQPLAAEEFRPRERPSRTVKQRVAGLHGVSQETQKLARRLYEVEIMTVREVAKALGEPYEKTYLILILAKTKFRRPGRRGSSGTYDIYDETPGIEEESEVADDVAAPPVGRTMKRIGRESARIDRGVREKMSEAEKALRRVLGSSLKTTRDAKTRIDASSVRTTSIGATRKKMSEAEKALRRVLR